MTPPEPVQSIADIATLQKRGKALFEQRRYADALECFRAAAAIEPDNPDALFDFGRALHTLGQHFWALAAFDRLLKARP